MSHVNSRRVVVLVLTLILTLCVGTVQAQEYRYRFVSLGGIEVPQGFYPFLWVGSFFRSWSEDHKAINNSGKIYGMVTEESAFVLHIAVYAHGTVTVVPEASVFEVANDSATIGGGVVIDPETLRTQAALFHGDDAGHYRVERIPPLPGEFTSAVMRLNDAGVALVSSWDGERGFSNETVFLYRNGQVQPVDFGPTITSPSRLNLNNQGMMSGTGDAGFRFNPRTGEVTPLHPLPTEPYAWALDINNRGDVLGYSFDFGGLERIGVWNRAAEFETYFVEGTQEVPTISNSLLFNDNNLIVITRVSDPEAELGHSYLVPQPGVRLNLADLVENLPPGQGLQYILSLNANGDMVGIDCPGFVCTDFFLLQRIGAGQ